MSTWGPQLPVDIKCKRPFGKAYEYWMAQEATFLRFNYAFSQRTVFQATLGRSLPCLPHFPPRQMVNFMLVKFVL